MATLAVSLAAQIAAIDARLTSVVPNSVSADGASVSHPDWIALSNQRMKLQSMLDRINGTSPMFPRGHVTGLGR